jgi:hypothetical protein
LVFGFSTSFFRILAVVYLALFSCTLFAQERSPSRRNSRAAVLVPDAKEMARRFEVFAREKLRYPLGLHEARNQFIVMVSGPALTAYLLPITVERISKGEIKLPPEKYWNSRTLKIAFFSTLSSELVDMTNEKFSGFYQVLISHAHQMTRERLLAPLSISDRKEIAIGMSRVLAMIAANEPSDRMWNQLPVTTQILFQKLGLLDPQIKATYFLWKDWFLYSGPTDSSSKPVSKDTMPILNTMPTSTIGRLKKILKDSGMSDEDIVNDVLKFFGTAHLNQSTLALSSDQKKRLIAALIRFTPSTQNEFADIRGQSRKASGLPREASYQIFADVYDRSIKRMQAEVQLINPLSCKSIAAAINSSLRLSGSR